MNLPTTRRYGLIKYGRLSLIRDCIVSGWAAMRFGVVQHTYIISDNPVKEKYEDFYPAS